MTAPASITHALLTPAQAGSQHRKAMTKLLERFTPRHRLWEVFGAWAECAALALANSVTPRGTSLWEKREERYHRVTDRFGDEGKEAFPRILAHLTEALTVEPRDQLGLLASELEVLSKGHAQYFTQYDVSYLMAQLAYRPEEIKAAVARNGYVTLQELAAGAGGMVIAFAQAMRDAGLNPQTQLHATCWDVEATAAHMCFIQLSLLHIPAVVVLGNTLTLESRDVLHTPTHAWGLWRYKLARRDEEADPPTQITLGPLSEQQALFDLAAAS